MYTNHKGSDGAVIGCLVIIALVWYFIFFFLPNEAKRATEARKIRMDAHLNYIMQPVRVKHREYVNCAPLPAAYMD